MNYLGISYDYQNKPALAEKITVMLPDEKARRVGRSIAAASLPEV